MGQIIIKHKNNIKAFSLIEMLVVLALFSTLTVLVTQSMAYALRGSKKSQNLSKVRSAINYSIDLMERDIRSSNNVVCGSNTVTITDENKRDILYACAESAPGIYYIASDSVRLTPDTVGLSVCSLGCSRDPQGIYPGKVSISISAYSIGSANDISGSINVNTVITLRNVQSN